MSSGRKPKIRRWKPVKISRYLLFPIAWIYGAVAAVRRALYRSGFCASYKSEIPTIGVGNLSVGGTGKTPHVEYLIRLLSEKYAMATLSRGYRRKTQGFVLANELAGTTLSVDGIGDEPLQFYTKFPQIKVAVAEKRKIGLQQLQKRFPELQCVVLDDCYQHLQVSPKCRILLTEYSQPYCDDFPVPMGRLREFKSAARWTDLVIVTKSPAELKIDQKEVWRKRLNLQEHQHLFFTTMKYGEWQPLTPIAREKQLDFTTEVVLLTAIAHPEPLCDYLKSKYKIIKHFQYPDHHYFSKSEIENIHNQYFIDKSKNRVLLTTEKDSMRLLYHEVGKCVNQMPLFSISIEVEFLFDEKEKFDQIIISYL